VLTQQPNEHVTRVLEFLSFKSEVLKILYSGRCRALVDDAAFLHEDNIVHEIKTFRRRLMNGRYYRLVVLLSQGVEQRH
jgi:hypothetical protein